MKKYAGYILLLLCCICLLFGCESQDDAKNGKVEETTTVDQIEMTESTTITTKVNADVETVQTTTLKAVKLDIDNRLEGLYKFNGIEFSVPSYLKVKEENNVKIKFTAKEIGDFTVMASNFSEKEYTSNQEKLETVVYDSFSNAFDSFERESSKKAYIGDKQVEYIIYNGMINNAKSKIYSVLFYDMNDELLYTIFLSHIDVYEYDFETDYVNILKNIKWIDPKSENKDADILQINQTFLSTDWSGNTVLVVEYTWTNTTDKTTSFLFNVSTKCFQNGVECEDALFCDDVGSGDLMKDVMPGYSTTVRKAYKINDMSDVTLQCCKFLSSTPFLETTIKLS